MVVWNSNDLLPEGVAEELKKIPEPAESVLARYDYLREDFLAAVGKAAAFKRRSQSSRAWEADAIFSLAGKLLKHSSRVVSEILPSPGGLEPSWSAAVTRGMESPGIGDAGVTITRETAGVRISARIFHCEGRLDLEVNLVDAVSGLDIRPFSMEVLGESGEKLLEPLEVGYACQPPLFPGPRPGKYILKFRWRKSEENLQIEFSE
jgi:hypothetical protein